MNSQPIAARSGRSYFQKTKLNKKNGNYSNLRLVNWIKMLKNLKYFVSVPRLKRSSTCVDYLTEINMHEISFMII